MPRFLSLLLFNLAGQLLLASFLHRFHLPPALNLILVVIIPTFPSLRRFRRNLMQSFPFLIASLTLLCSIDDIYILSKQGWNADGVPYFRGPFNNDAERNVVLVNAAIRGTASPFFPNTVPIYQSLWIRWAAAYVAPFDSISNYSLVMGAHLITGMLLTFVLLSAMVHLRPSLLNQPLLFCGLALFLSFHTELMNLVVSLMRHGTWGIEPPWDNLSWNPFSYYSSQFLALVSPQHALFFIFLIPALLYQNLLTVFMAFLASPVLAVLFLVPCLFTFPKKKELLAIALVLGMGYLVYHFLFGYSPLLLFLRDSASTIEWGWGSWTTWRLLPLFPIASFGVMGLTIYFGFLSKESWRSPYLRMIFVGGVLFNLFFTNLELARHFSMIAAILFSLWFAKYFQEQKWVYGLPLFLIGLGMHLYFVYFLTVPPSNLSPQAAWKDYFQMNKTIRKQFPQLNVFSAPSERLGLIKPIVMEATTGFCHPEQVEIYTLIPRTKKELWNKVWEGGPTRLPLQAKALGYQALEWGPVEEMEWGEPIRRLLVDEKKLMAVEGNVRLYRLD